MSDQDMVVLVQTLLNYLGTPASKADPVEIEATIQRFRKLNPDYSLAHSPKEDGLQP